MKNSNRVPEKGSKGPQPNNLRSSREQLFYLALFIVFVIVSIYVDRTGSSFATSRKTALQSGWTVEAMGEETDLSGLPAGPVTVSKMVEGLYGAGQAICFKSVDTNFELLSDGEVFYTYRPVIPKRLGRSYGMYVHTVVIPAGTKVLSMVLEPVFSGVPAGISNVYITTGQQYLAEFFRSSMPALLQSATILLIGLIFLLVGIFSRLLMTTAGLDFVSFGIMSMLIGLSGFNDTVLLQIMSGHPALIRVVTYICLIFIPFPMVSYFAGVARRSRSVAVPLTMVLCLVNFVLQVFLTHRGISDYFYLVYISHGLIALGFIVSVVTIIRAGRSDQIQKELLRVTTIGIFASLLGVIIDLLRFYFASSNGSQTTIRTGMLFFMVLMGVYLFREQTRAMKLKQKENQIYIRELSQAFAKVIDMKDRYTNGHSSRVAGYTSMLAKELGYDAETVEKYYCIALLHDIGKIGIPKSVLLKPGKLNDEEYELIKSHAEKGYEVLKDISAMPELAVGARYHHERPDGKGYPAGLREEEIPRVAQIIAVADCFDAMYSDRPYRKCLPFDTAVNTIREVSGTQLEPDVVEAFMRLVRKGILHPRKEGEKAN